MPTIYGYIDLVKNEIRNAVMQNLGSAPASPVKGLMYFDTTANIFYWYNGTAWIPAQSGASLNPATTVTTQAIGDTPVVGTLSTYAREDHKHGQPIFAAPTAQTSFGMSSAAGSAATLPHSDHTHGTPVHDNAAHAAISLSALSAPLVDVDMGGMRLKNLAIPSATSDATTKAYVDGAIAGLAWKDAARAATTANITLSGLQTIDGVSVAAGDRVLVKNQTTAAQNGIYTAASTAWIRTSDADQEADLIGASVFVSEGVANGNTSWVMTTDAPITVDTTALTWVQFSGAGTFVAGNGLTLTGNVFDVGAGTGITVAADSVAVDTTTIATRSYVDTGIGATALINAGNGLTKTGQTVDVVGGTGIVVAADLVSVDTAVIATQAYVNTAVTGMVKKFAAALTGTASPETVTHNLNTRDVHVSVYNGASPYTAVQVDWDAATVNTVTVRYNPNLGAGYRVVVVG